MGTSAGGRRQRLPQSPGDVPRIGQSLPPTHDEDNEGRTAERVGVAGREPRVCRSRRQGRGHPHTSRTEQRAPAPRITKPPAQPPSATPATS